MHAGTGLAALVAARPVARSCAFFVAAFVASYVGVLTFYEPAQISLIWPLSGVAAVWLVTSTPRRAVPDLLLLGLASALSVWLVIGGWDLALVGAVLAQGFLVCMMLVALVLSLSLRDRQTAIAEAERVAEIARDRAALLSAVLSSIDEGILVVQDDDHIVLDNAASRRLLPHLDHVKSSTTSPEHSRYVFTLPDGSPIATHPLTNRRAFDGTFETATDLDVRRGGKLVRTLQVVAAPLPSTSTNQQARAVLTLRDVTAEREERSELEGFAGIVAHDLANPLTIIVGWSEALLELADDPDHVSDEDLRTLARRLLGASSHMQTFINDLLAYTLSRNYALQTTALDLSHMARTIVDLRQASDAVAVQPDIRASGDEALLRQLLDNLIANALKYVDADTRPQVSISATRDDQHVTVTVHDNGIGINDDERAQVFEDFFRASAVRTTYRGTGLGLAICKRVVSRHGGEIWVDHSITAPQDGHGTRVCFTLPHASQ